MNAVLAARGLSTGYLGRPVVHDIDLEVSAGEIVTLLGRNGAGKTSTLLALAGELPPLGGHVEWQGSPSQDRLHRRAKRGLSFVTEERSVIMSLSVRDNLRLGGNVDDALELFPELRLLLNRRAGLLSGGEQQMLTLARAISRRPLVLLADELSLGLAPMIVDRLLSALRTAADSGIAVLFVEQHVRKALATADRAYVMQRGRIELAGTAGELRGRLGDVERSYLSAHESDGATAGPSANGTNRREGTR